jgi:hypothetical protein
MALAIREQMDATVPRNGPWTAMDAHGPAETSNANHA